MEKEFLAGIMRAVADGDKTPQEAVEALKNLPYDDMGFAKLDEHRELRTGYPEVVFGLGKTPDQVARIMKRLSESNSLVLTTKATPAHYNAVLKEIPDAAYHTDAGIISAGRKKETEHRRYVAVVTAGTADLPIAEEAALTLEFYGNNVKRIFDVGVAGIHRLFDQAEDIKGANVLIVVAGMEGALAGVVAGLVDRPVIAVPTSVGYGASMGGLTALLAMLNSCSLGVSVMNIDNGFGAGHLASMINR